MKTATDRIKHRKRKDCSMTTISIRMPEDLIEDLKEIAPSLGFAGYQPLIRCLAPRHRSRFIRIAPVRVVGYVGSDTRLRCRRSASQQ